MRKFGKQLLAGPYLVWIIGFIILPVFAVLYYALTNSAGSFTMENIAAIAEPVHLKALFSIKTGCDLYPDLPAALLSTGNDLKQYEDQRAQLCGLSLCTSDVDEFYASYFSMADAFIE